MTRPRTYSYRLMNPDEGPRIVETFAREHGGQDQRFEGIPYKIGTVGMVNNRVSVQILPTKQQLSERDISDVACQLDDFMRAAITATTGRPIGEDSVCGFPDPVRG